MRVLIATDESDHAVLVAERARCLFGDEVEYLFLNVAAFPAPTGWAAGWGASTPMTAAATFDGSIEDALTTSQLQLLARKAKRHAAEICARTPMLSAEPIGDVGDPVNCILAAAHARSVDVIAVGFHDRSWLSRLFVPAVSKEVVRVSDIPVLVVR
jgi:nucleotide-binding universal stress UspA family protein